MGCFGCFLTRWWLGTFNPTSEGIMPWLFNHRAISQLIGGQLFKRIFIKLSSN
jgi:hypothetical protein